MKCESSDEEGFAGRLPAGIYLFKSNNRNTRTRCEIWSKFSVSIVKFDKYMPGGRLATLFKKRLTVFEFLSREYILLSSI